MTSDYTFTLHPTVLAVDGTPLVDAHVVTYTSAGFLQVLETLPSDDAVQVPVDSEITVVFDRPVIPLLTSASAIDLPQPLLLSPSVNGVRRVDQQRSLYIHAGRTPFKKEPPIPPALNRIFRQLMAQCLALPFAGLFKRQCHAC